MVVRMTNLERLIKAHTEATTITTLSATTERFIEELAREWMKDEAVKAEIQALARKYFATTVETLRTPARNGRPRAKTGRRRTRARE